MNGDPKLYQLLSELAIAFDYYEHPPAPTIEKAMEYWKDLDATHCKNLFFRNHKGNRHYLVVLDHRQQLDIHELERKLGQGKLSFASDERMARYLQLTPGSVTPFGLMNDLQNHVHVFLDRKLCQSRTISFHPCINTASIVLRWDDFVHFMDWTGNTYEFIDLYQEP